LQFPKYILSNFNETKALDFAGVNPAIPAVHADRADSDENGHRFRSKAATCSD
jgi:hypothetical protein